MIIIASPALHESKAGLRKISKNMEHHAKSQRGYRGLDWRLYRGNPDFLGAGLYFSFSYPVSPLTLNNSVVIK